MGRPELRSDCADLEWFQQDQNIVCSRNLLEALMSNHGRELIEEDDPAPVEPLPPPIRLVVEDTTIQFAPHKVDIIKRLVCEHFKISKTGIESASRKNEFVRPRQIAIYLARKLTQHSFPEIARRFGDRDHTTAISACRRIEELITLDSGIATDVALLEAAIA